MPLTTFSVQVRFRGRQQWAAFIRKLGSFKDVFSAIIDRWTAGNVAKFEKTQGRENSGYYFGGDVTWDPLKSAAYQAEKRRAGFPDWLMVRTGELKQSLTDRKDLYFYEEITDDQATFGTLDKKAEWNANTRPVMFLDETDQQMILEMFGAFMEDEPPFRPFTGAGQAMDREYKGIFQWA